MTATSDKTCTVKQWSYVEGTEDDIEVFKLSCGHEVGMLDTGYDIGFCPICGARIEGELYVRS